MPPVATLMNVHLLGAESTHSAWLSSATLLRLRTSPGRSPLSSTSRAAVIGWKVKNLILRTDVLAWVSSCGDLDDKFEINSEVQRGTHFGQQKQNITYVG